MKRLWFKLSFKYLRICFFYICFLGMCTAFGQSRSPLPFVSNNIHDNISSVLIAEISGDSIKNVLVINFIENGDTIFGKIDSTVITKIQYLNGVNGKISGFFLVGKDQINNQTLVGLKQYSLYRKDFDSKVEFVKVWELGETYLSSPETIRFEYNQQELLTKISCDHNHSIDEFIVFPKEYKGVDGVLTLIYEYDSQGNWIKEYVQEKTGKQLLRQRIIIYK